MSDQQLINFSNRGGIVTTFLFVLGFLAPNAWAASGCTPLRVKANGKYIPTPTAVTLAVAKTGKPVSVPIINGCFQLPSSFKKAKRIDVRFEANGEKIHLKEVELDAFSESWTVVLNDSVPDALLTTLKSASAKEVCVLELEPSDGDGVAIAQAGCRSPAK